jgi:hypothetical protein
MGLERIGGSKIGSGNLDKLTVSEGVITVDSQSGGAAGGEIIFNEGSANGTNSVTLTAPASVTTSVTITLPDGDGNSGEFLKTDGNGVTSWGAASSSLTASDILQIQIFS